MRLIKEKTLNQIKKKGSGKVGKEKDDEKKMEVHAVVTIRYTDGFTHFMIIVRRSHFLRRSLLA